MLPRPVLLTVDDDPSVSRAVARDLRRRYGEDYRIVRAESGADALDALKEILRRGERVAAILADYRMPQMNGIEFLEQAMDLFPHARRALLTAYADTDAAIQAINVVDVDHYLLKPWEPPEEKLYPVVDELIATWQSTGDQRGDRDQGHRPPLVAAVVRGPRLPGPQLGPLPLVRRGRAGRASGCSAAARRRPTSDVPVVITPDGTVLRARRSPSSRRRSGCRRRRRATSTTSSSSAAARPGWARPSTARPRACARCSSTGRRPAGRPGRAAGSRTTSASPTASPAPS